MPRRAHRHDQITFRIDALAQGWRGLETAQRAREAECEAIRGETFECRERRHNLIQEIEQDTHAQVALMRAVVATPASDLADVVEKLRLLQDQTAQCGFDGMDDLLASAINDLQAMTG
jgi:hypothetical protein